AVAVKTGQRTGCPSVSPAKPAKWRGLPMRKSSGWGRRRGAVWPTEGPTMAKRDVWSIGIYTGGAPLHLQPRLVPAPHPNPLPQGEGKEGRGTAAHNPVLTAAQVTDVRATFVADPFMIRAHQTWYMFFEIYRAQEQRGIIGLATSRDGWHWQY